MKKVLIVLTMAGLIYSCSGNGSDQKDKLAQSSGTQGSAANSDTLSTNEKGIGKFTHVDVSPNLDHKLADGGKSIYDMKCSSCHKLTSEKLVGPGWKGVTERRKPEWIMNFVTNTEEMLVKDAKAQSLLEICLVQMPNQHLTDDDARKMLEFMRQNDGVK
ncbi:MAG: cytochrome c [Bacteroidota bacterium]|nr:cytochrome c [Bacteroidota bacterium]MDP4216561.1 cytochrome c [Bacteroidota bacterium]MDP4245025.1 cytochrome c [Bacteroidota bacterium]MDP4252860.1 cytochrome c [Bacteroidota bacterium]MDP4259852.1 cytochrome c [Bacteroidota bacterium]